VQQENRMSEPREPMPDPRRGPEQEPPAPPNRDIPPVREPFPSDEPDEDEPPAPNPDENRDPPLHAADATPPRPVPEPMLIPDPAPDDPCRRGG
jgi:hypothetical protein